MDDTYLKLSTRAEEIQRAADEISKRFTNLTTFEEAALWKSDACALVRLLQIFCTDFARYRAGQAEALKQTETARSSQSFLKRAFVSKEEKQYKENFEKADKAIASIQKAIEDLSDLIERTPTSPAEQKQMLQELREIKKELTVEKRTVNENMRQIRTQARQDMAHVAGSRGSWARYSRASTTHSKERALAPQEEAKASIERELIEVEKRINWTSKFTGNGNEPQQAVSVYICAYCGRQIEPGKVCAGCGSDQVVIDPR